jgi:antitoxin component YwqK of YwqJK toxin-antitoxin module
MLINLLSNKDNTVLECYSPNGKILQEKLLYHAPDPIDDKVLACEYSYYDDGNLMHLTIFSNFITEEYSYYSETKQLNRYSHHDDFSKLHIIKKFFENGVLSHFCSNFFEVYYSSEGKLLRYRNYKTGAWSEWMTPETESPLTIDDLIIDAEIKEIIKQDTVVGIEK